MNLFDELTALLTALREDEVPYALCGGLAVAVHGAPRATRDIDLLVPREAVERALATAGRLGFRFPAAPMQFRDGMELFRVNKVERGALLTLDLLVVEANTQEAWDSRETRNLGSTELVVVSRDALMRMKAGAGRPIDLADLERLAGDDR